MTLAVNIAQGGSNNVTFRNRIINGAMVIDQRNAGASVTNTTGYVYGIDRFSFIGSSASKFTCQQSSTAPNGFINSYLITSSAATTVASGDYYFLRHMVEGFNTADLGWGTANAQTVTLSFWVRSSLTGTFGGSFRNSAENRSYPFTYTISSANTFEYKTITVPGDQTGTWLTTNGTGINLVFGLGIGSSLSGPAGAWAGANYNSATGATNVVSTNGATFYITGVQLEAGTTASPFEYRQYGTELALCQRYCQTISTSNGITGNYAFGSIFVSSRAWLTYLPTVTFRTTPSITYPSVSGASVDVVGVAPSSFTSYTNFYLSASSVSFYTSGLAGSPTIGNPAALILASSQTIVISAEL